MLYCRYRLSADIKFYKLFLTNLVKGTHKHNKDVPTLNKKLKEFFNTEQLLVVNQARLGFYLYLKKVLNEGDEVLISSYTLIDMVNMIICAGGKPVFVDTDIDSFFMDKKDLKRKITSRTKVIVHTTLYGIIEDISEVLSIAKENNLLVFEDCAQGFGTQINHQFGGLRGDAGVFSFGALKNVNGLFGGALFIKDKTVFERVEKFNKSLPLLSITKLLRKYLFCLSYEVITHPWIYNVFSRSIMKKFDELGHVDKDAKIKFEIPKESLVQLTSLQAKLILHSLKRFKKEQGRSNIFGLNLLTQIEDIPKIGYEHKYLQYPVVLKDRNTIIKNYMRDLGIDVNIDFFRDLNSLDCFKQYRSSCPNVGHMIHHLVLFPTYSRQSKAYNELVCLELKKRANSS